MRNSKSSEVMTHHSVDDISIAGTVYALLTVYVKVQDSQTSRYKLDFFFTRWTDTCVLQLQHIFTYNIRENSKGQKAMHASWLYRKRKTRLQMLYQVMGTWIYSWF
jgi:hypothetical protein